MWEPLLSTSEELRVRLGADDDAIVDLDLRVVEHARTGPILFDVSTEAFSARYELDLSDGSMRYRATGTELELSPPAPAPGP